MIKCIYNFWKPATQTALKAPLHTTSSLPSVTGQNFAKTTVENVSDYVVVFLFSIGYNDLSSGIYTYLQCH